MNKEAFDHTFSHEFSSFSFAASLVLIALPTMAKLLIDKPIKPEKIKPKPGSQRRNSTGNASTIFSEPNPVPNYLRASIGSCHDRCKYGGRRDFPAEPEQDRNRYEKPGARSKTNNRGKMTSEAKNLVPLSSRKQPSEAKPKPLVRKQANEISETSRNDAGKGLRMLKASKKTSSSVKIPSAKIQTSKSPTKEVSQSKIKKSADLPERIIHVAEQNPNLNHQNVDHSDQESNPSPPPCSSPNQKEKTDSAPKSWNKAIGIGRVVMKENGSSPRKHRIKMEKALGIGIGNGEVVHDEHSIHEEDESITVASSKLARMMSRCKVKALVDGFETMVNIQDSKSLRGLRRRRYYMWRGEQCNTRCNTMLR